MVSDRVGQDVGEFNEDGSIKADAVVCAYSHRNCKGIHAVRERVVGTRYFYRILTDVHHEVTDDWRAEFAQSLVEQPKEPKARKGAIVEEVTNDSI